MKKTLTVNLGGTVFHIDEDAYRLLDNYLSNLKIHFRKEAGADEIIDDIERRISELFTEKLVAGSQVITIAYVEEVIARMGKPEELEPDAGDADSGSGSWDGSNHAGNTIIRKSKFPQNPKRSVRFSGKRTKRSVQKRKARNTQKAETKVL